MKFRTYGTSKIIIDYKYPADKETRTKLNYLNKPKGLWASPIGHRFKTWYNFCKSEDFCLDSLKAYVDFSIDKSSKVLYLRSNREFEMAYKNYGHYTSIYGSDKDCLCLDWERIEEEYDAVYFSVIGFNRLIVNRDVNYNFYSWDVDSLVVFNLKKINCK